MARFRIGSSTIGSNFRLAGINLAASDIIFRYSTTAGTAGNQNAGTAVGSLGKYVSTTAIPNNQLHNLFDLVSSTEDASSSSEYHCFFVYNSHQADTYKSVVIYLSAEVIGGANTAIGIDTTAASDASSAPVQALTIVNEDTAPTGITFSSPTSQTNGVLIGDLGPNQVRAVWVKRTTTNSGGLLNDGVTLTAEGKL